MRNAVLTMVGSMLTSVLLTERTDSNLHTRDQLLDILEERINDVSAYTRKCALQVGWRVAGESTRVFYMFWFSKL